MPVSVGVSVCLSNKASIVLSKGSVEGSVIFEGSTVGSACVLLSDDVGFSILSGIAIGT